MGALLSNFKISVNPDIYLKDSESSELGESSLFIINSREAKLIESQVKDIVLENKLLAAKSELYKIRSLTF